MTLSVHALADAHVARVLTECRDWEELAKFGAPYWRPRSSAELRRKIEAAAGPQASSEYNFVLTSADDALVGECSLHAIDWRNGVAQIGVCIWRPDQRQRGYGSAAVRRMMDWGFGYLGLNRLEAWIVEGNEPSLNLFNQLGFDHEGTLRHRYLYAGQRKDMHVMALCAPA